jgi:hypothetical protein
MATIDRFIPQTDARVQSKSAHEDKRYRSIDG